MTFHSLDQLLLGGNNSIVGVLVQKLTWSERVPASRGSKEAATILKNMVHLKPTCTGTVFVVKVV